MQLVIKYIEKGVSIYYFDSFLKNKNYNFF